MGDIGRFGLLWISLGSYRCGGCNGIGHVTFRSKLHPLLSLQNLHKLRWQNKVDEVLLLGPM